MNNTITNPKGIDLVIQELQTYIHNQIGWDNINVYGRVYRNPSKKKGSAIEAYISDGEYRDVLTDDSKKATIFFIEDDKHDTKDGFRFTTKVKIVFIVNLKLIFPSLLHRADSEAEIKATELLRTRSVFSMTEIEKGIDAVFRDFNTEDIKLSDMQPFHIFSVNGNIEYQINCF